MPRRIHGAASSQQNLSASIQTFMCYASSPGAFTDPNPNPPEDQEAVRLVNILTTGEISDQSQKNFEILLQTIAFRAMPVIMGDAMAVFDLSTEAPTLTGEGYSWMFSVEREDVFLDFGTKDPVGLLTKEIDGAIIDSGIRLTTVDGSPSGVPKNIEFVKIGQY